MLVIRTAALIILEWFHQKKHESNIQYWNKKHRISTRWNFVHLDQPFGWREPQICCEVCVWWSNVYILFLMVFSRLAYIDFMGAWELYHNMILISRPHSKVAKPTNRYHKKLCWKWALVNMSYDFIYLYIYMQGGIYLYLYIFFTQHDAECAFWFQSFGFPFCCWNVFIGRRNWPFGILLDIRTVCGFTIASFALDVLRENILDCSRQQYGISFCAMILRYLYSSIHRSHHWFHFPCKFLKRLFCFARELSSTSNKKTSGRKLLQHLWLETVALDLRSQWWKNSVCWNMFDCIVSIRWHFETFEVTVVN